MRIDLITLFSVLCQNVMSESIIGRAQNKGALKIECHQLRDYAFDKHKRVDDAPYGGGMGMLLMAEPIALCFEDICKQYLWKLLLEGKCAVNFTDLGRWWGANPKTKSQEEIDIMGTDKDTALFAECKWTNEKVDLGVLETLVERSTLFSYKKTHFYLFAKTGFTKDCVDRSNEMGNVTLVTYEDILKA